MARDFLRDPFVAARVLVASAGVFSAGAFLLLALQRIGHPFELEWMEGATLEHVRRILGGQPIYVEPSTDFVPQIYTPFYLWASALVARALGDGFLALRAVSLAAAFGCFLWIFRVVRRETSDSAAAMAGAGLFAATYGESGFFFDVGRADMLFLFFALGAFACVRPGASRRELLAGAALAVLAYLTKQVALSVWGALVVVCAVLHGRAGLWFALPSAIGIAGSSLLLDAASEGWFRYYAYFVPSRHRYRPSMWTGYWTAHVLRLWLPLFLAGIGFLLLWYGRERRRLVYLALPLGAMLVTSWYVRLKAGSHLNTLMPAHALVAVCFGWSLPGLARSVRDAARGRFASPAAALVALVFLVPFVQLRWDGARRVPSPEDRASGERLLERLSSTEGDVLVPSHGYLGALAGKRAFAHAQAVVDILAADPERGEELRRDYAELVRARRFGAVVVDGDFLSLSEELRAFYALEGPVFADDESFYPVTGYRTRPRSWWVPTTGP